MEWLRQLGSLRRCDRNMGRRGSGRVSGRSGVSDGSGRGVMEEVVTGVKDVKAAIEVLEAAQGVWAVEAQGGLGVVGGFILLHSACASFEVLAAYWKESAKDRGEGGRRGQCES